MWPMYVDYTDDDCKKVLRSLELEAYASVINAFRAQGSLSKERKKMLQELCSILSISLERHRAEIRRAVNDEHLNTIAERLSGPNTSTEWAIEGRRLVPLVPRLVPQTVFTAIANSVASAQAAKNATLPMPGKTGQHLNNNEEDIMETMMCRKRKEPPTDMTASPSKYMAIDNQFANSSCHFEGVNAFLPETIQSINDSSISDCSTVSISSTTQITPPFDDYNPIKATMMSSGTTNTSPIRSPSKHLITKPASTVTTFSSLDQLTSNVTLSKPISSSYVQGLSHEEQVSAAEAKSLSDIQSISRFSQSPCSVKSPPVTAGINSTNSSSLTGDRLPVASSPSSSGIKISTQTKPKTTHVKQATTVGLGLKTNSQSSVGQHSVSPKSTNTKAKQEATTSLTSFMKKQTSIVHPQPPASENSVTAPSSLLTNESVPMLKSPLPITTKSSVTKSECSSTSNQSILQPPTTKVTTLPKTFHKTTTHGSSQFVARTLFSSTAKTGAKSLPPVIFNVSTNACSPIQSAAKTTMPGQSETTKVTTPQLLPKSSSGISGLSANQFKLSTSNAPTIQYRNEGGMVRSARIVNISQPVGSRLPCAISPSAISALGLSSGLTSTALRVTLPPGTLNTSSALRVSAAAKPNVIVVHKAQMWPRSQGAAAVIMSSTGSIPRLSNDVLQETIALSQKQEKNRQCTKNLPRPIAPANSQTPVVTSASIKVPDVNSLAALSTKGLQSDNIQPDSTSTKISESVEEAKCKMNLLADVIEVSGIMMEGSPEKNSKKVIDLQHKDSHRLKPVAEPRNNKTSEGTNAVTKTEDVTSIASMQGLNVDKLEIIRAASPSLSLLASQNSEAEKKVSDAPQRTLIQIDSMKVRKPCDIFPSRTQEGIKRNSSCESETKQTTPDAI